jgi:hypothetical protein
VLDRNVVFDHNVVDPLVDVLADVVSSDVSALVDSFDVSALFDS